MTVEQNAALIRGGYEAFGAGDLPALLEFFAEDVVWHYPGMSPLAGDHVGRSAVLGMLGQFMERTGGNYQAQLREVMAGERYATGWARDVGTRDGRSLDVNAVVVFRVSENKVVEAWHYFDDMPALDAFWA